MFVSVATTVVFEIIIMQGRARKFISAVYISDSGIDRSNSRRESHIPVGRTSRGTMACHLDFRGMRHDRCIHIRLCREGLLSLS